jgi:hypothetical protein
VGAKVRVFVRNPEELANERAELSWLLNKAGTCFLHEMSLSTASGRPWIDTCCRHCWRYCKHRKDCFTDVGKFATAYTATWPSSYHRLANFQTWNGDHPNVAIVSVPIYPATVT